MKLTKGKKIFRNQILNHHLKNSSQDISNPHRNIFISKLIKNNPGVENESLIKDSLPNIKKSIQNIFSSEDRKEKAFQYLIKKSKEKTINNTLDLKKSIDSYLNTPQNRNLRKNRVIAPYNNKKLNPKTLINSYDISKSNIDIRPSKMEKKDDVKSSYRYSGSVKFISEDEPLNQNDIYKENNFYQSNFSIFSNLTTNKHNNKNKNNKNEDKSHSYTYNNSPTSNLKKKKNINNQNLTYDYLKNYSLRNSINNSNYLDINPYKEYLKTTNITNIKKSIIKKDIEKSINNSNIISNNNDNNNENKDIYDSKNIKNNYYINDNFYNKKIKYVKKSNLYAQNDEKSNNNNYVKKSPIKSNNSVINNNSNKKFYIHKKLGYKESGQKNLFKNSVNSYSRNSRNNNNIENNDLKKQNKVYYNTYFSKDIRLNTLQNKKRIPRIYRRENIYNGNDLSQEKTVEINIDKNQKIQKLTTLFNSVKINKTNKDDELLKRNNNKKIYTKRNTHQRPSRNIYENNTDFLSENNFNNDINKSKNKIIFNDEEEILSYIKRKYNKRKMEEIYDREDNGMVVNDSEKGNEKKYPGMMTTEEGDKIKQKNEELSTEIKQLKNENRLYKKELNDIKNKFNDLSKEIISIKEKKY